MILVYSMGRVGTTSIVKATGGLPAHYLAHAGEWVLDGYNKELDEAKQRGDLKIITPIREPVSRIISAFNFRQPTNETFDQYWYGYTLHWFDNEFKSYTGFDVYDHHFPIDLGYAIYETPIAPVLIIQLKKLNSIGADVIGDFCGIEINEMPWEERLEYEALEVSREFVEMIYKSKFAHHFFEDRGLYDD